jgi:hypothetical protein
MLFHRSRRPPRQGFAPPPVFAENYHSQAHNRSIDSRTALQEAATMTEAIQPIAPRADHSALGALNRGAPGAGERAPNPPASPGNKKLKINIFPSLAD